MKSDGTDIARASVWQFGDFPWLDPVLLVGGWSSSILCGPWIAFLKVLLCPLHSLGSSLVGVGDYVLLGSLEISQLTSAYAGLEPGIVSICWRLFRLGLWILLQYNFLRISVGLWSTCFMSVSRASRHIQHSFLDIFFRTSQVRFITLKSHSQTSFSL